MNEVFPGVFREDNEFYTHNAVSGTKAYGERLLQHDGEEYRQWDPNRSKAAAALKKGLGTFPIEPDSSMVYLGASTGTTVSHMSDILTEGIVYAVEYSPKITRQLVSLTDDRENIAPILGDARKPKEYAPLCSQADAIYQDVAQPDQINILKRNADTFLKEDGYALLAIKAQSISSTQSANDIFTEAKESLSEDFDILEGKKLSPFHTDHLFLVLQALE